MKRIVTGFCMAVMVWAGALQGAEKLRIPEGEAGKTDEAYLVEKAIPFYTRHLVDSFDPATITFKERIPDILAIRKALVLHYSTGNRFHCNPVIREKARILIKGSCKDPGVALMAADDSTFSIDERLKMINIAIDVMKKAGNPDPMMMTFLMKKRFWLKPDDEHEAAFCASLATAFTGDHGFSQADSRIVLRFLESAKRDKLHPKGIFEIQMPDPWVQMVLRGEDLATEAFQVRGTELGYKVTDEGWKGFAEKNKQGYRLLAAAHALHPDFSDAATELVGVAHHTGGKSPVYWLNQALAASLDASGAVKTHAHFSTSRWCGSTDEIIALAKACMRSKRYDSLLPFTGMRIVIETIPRYEMGMPEVAEAYLRADRELFDLLYATVEGYLAEPGHVKTGPRDFYARAGIVVALYDRDWARAKAFAGKISLPRHYISRDWPFLADMTTLREVHHYVLAIKCLLANGFTDDVGRAESLATSGRNKEAMALFEEIRNREKAVAAEQNYCDVRFFVLRARTGMKSGEWFSLMPTVSNSESMSFWSRCKVEKGIVRGRNNTQTQQCGTTPLPDDNIEFAGTIHFFPNAKQKKWEAGWIFTHRYDCVTSFVPEFHFVRENGQDTILVKRRTELYKTISLEGTPTIREFHAVVKDGRFTFNVDGKAVFDEPRDSLLNDAPMGYLGGNCVLPVIDVNVNTGISDYRCRVLPGWDDHRPWSSPAFHD